MFIDSSAIIAILSREPDRGEYAAKISAASRKLSSPHVTLETCMRLGSILAVDPRVAETAVLEFYNESEIQIVPVDEVIAHVAVSAFARFGKGRGHKAQLNFGDCLSYACARVHDVPLLFKGLDFAHTDVLRA